MTASSSEGNSHRSRQRPDTQPHSALPSECGLTADSSDRFIGGLAKVRGGIVAPLFSNPWMVTLLAPREVMQRQIVVASSYTRYARFWWVVESASLFTSSTARMD